jgi:hypothetical protein
MPFIAVPGVCQVKLSGAVEGHPWVTILHFKLAAVGNNWTTAQLNALCDGLMTGIAVTNGLGSLTNSTASFQSAIAVDLGTPTPATGANTHAAITGSDLTGPVPPSVCVLVQDVIPDRYRGGHPRHYMPPMGGGALTATQDSWTTAKIGAYATAYSSMINGATGAVPACSNCAVRYNYTYTDVPAKHKWMHTRSSFNDAPLITNWLVKANIAGQSRRAKIGG